MCGCNANFNGNNGVEEIEDKKYLDFDGDVEEVSLDAEFENASGKKEEKLEGQAMAYSDYSDCVRNKPRLRLMKNWEPACSRVHGSGSSSGGSGSSGGGSGSGDDMDYGTEGGLDNGSGEGNGKKIALIGGGIVALGVIGFLVFKAVKK